MSERAGRRGAVAAVLVLVASACDAPASTLQAAGPAARRNGLLFWGMAATAAFVLLVVVGLLLYGLFRRRRRAEDGGEPITTDTGGVRMIIVGGIAFPVIVLLTLFVLTMLALQSQAAEDQSGATLHVQVIGHRWWWEIRYPDSGAITANELHIPVGARVQIDLRSADVIHSLWIPRLGRKMDAIPGRTNTFSIEADTLGTFRGECAEFCGTEHARMAMVVVAEPVSTFGSWLQGQALDAQQPTTALQRQGLATFLDVGCDDCHTIRGTPADGPYAPDLTHLASRETLAAATLANNTGDLGGWISNPNPLKPGVLMPATPMRGRSLRALLAYLESLH